jgi:hypothetical protein
MQEEDRNRYKILIAGGTEVFERMQGNISTLNARNMTLIGIILATLSIILTLLLFLSNGDTFFKCRLDLIIPFLPFLSHFVSYNYFTLYSDRV